MLPRSARLSLSTVLCLALCLALAGCGKDEEPAARKVANALASGLASGSLTAVAWTGADPTSDYRQVAGPIATAEPRVEVAAVTVRDNTATATLDWKVELRGGTWTHATKVGLTRSGGAWQATWAPSVVESSLKPGETLGVTTLEARRGRILGAGGAVLVRPRPVLRIGIDKTRVPPGKTAAAARSLAGVMGLDPRKFSTEVEKAGPEAFVEGIVMRRGDVGTSMFNRITAIRGALAISDRRSLAPTRDFAAAILGTVGPVTAELVKDSRGRLAPGDVTGLSGLQKRYDEQLSGTPGSKVVAVDAKGDRRKLFDTSAVAGADLRTTLAPRLQEQAQQDLSGIGPASALVAIRPSTGEILVAASGPGSKGYNTATFGQYAPGSTFKMVSALALLRAGLTTTSQVSCTPTITVNGKQFKNYSDYPSSRLGEITLEEALANSCNTGFISQAAKLSPRDLASAGASLGIGVDHDLGFPAYFGSVPPAATDTEGAADMIGQGRVLASPIAMATVLSSVVKGSTVVPWLVDGHTAKAAPAHPLTAAETAALRSMLRAVVREGSGALLQSLGAGVLAKTGTAEYGDKPPLPTHAWMVGAHGDLAVAVFVADGSSGSGTAGPVLKRFLTAAAR